MSEEKKKNNDSETFMERMKNDKMFARYIYSGVAIIAVLVIIIVCVLASNDDGTAKSEEKKNKTESGAEQDETAEADLDSELPLDNIFIDDGSLQENAYENVNQLVAQYFTALAAGDRETVSTLKSDTTEEELVKIEKKSAYIQDFENIKVYTKLGAVENSYIAFVYYDINFTDVERLAPGLSTLYICPDEEGVLHIYDGELDDAASKKIKEAAAEDDVMDLFNKVTASYNEAIESDENLKAFMEELPAKLDAEVAEAMAQNKAEEEQKPQEEAPAQAEDATGKTEIVETTDAVNVRASDSENADKIGRLDLGSKVTRYESKGNGWSRIDYEGQTGYVKSEYLKAVGGGSDQTQTPSDTGTSSQTAEGTVTVRETVNVRKSEGEGAEKIGVAYEGEHYELIMKLADGWTKIKYNGQIGFVKSEYLEF